MIRDYIKNSNNTLRVLKDNRVKSEKAMKQLSSGLRINSASDDSAGLSISEKMRAQIRGLSQAENNIQDGISLTQIADGGMNEINEILQRVRKLSVQAANDSNTDIDREAIQAEVDGMISEIDRITDSTEFNGIKVLKGGGIQTGPYKETTVGNMPQWTKPFPDRLTQYKVGTFIKDDGTVVDKKYSVAEIDFSRANAGNIQDLVGNGFYSTCCTCTEKYSIRFVNGATNSTGSPNPIIEIDVSNVQDGKSLVKEIERQSQPYMTHFTKFMVDTKNPDKLYIVDPRIDAVPDTSKDLGIVGAGVVVTTIINGTDTAKEINIQSGPNSGDNLKIKLPDTTCDTLEIIPILVRSSNEANASLRKIDGAIEIVNKGRTKMGSYENRLVHSYNNASNTGENMQASESRIRDADMAKSMLQYSKNLILEQSDNAIISQVRSVSSDIVNNLLMS